MSWSSDDMADHASASCLNDRRSESLSCTDYDTCEECASDPSCIYCESANVCQLKTAACLSPITSVSNCSLSCSVLNKTTCSDGSRCDCIGCGSACWFSPDGKNVPSRACTGKVSYHCNSSGPDVMLIVGLVLLALLAIVAVAMLLVLVYNLVSQRTRRTYVELR
jgi:hypothetical protein